MKNWLRMLAGVILLLLIPAQGRAHPHVWADIKVQVIFDDKGLLTGLHETWLFDDFYSAFVIGGGATQEQLESVLAENMKNLEEYDYFTRIMSGETRITGAKPEQASSRITGNRLEMSFLLQLPAPLSVSDLPMRYAVYDPAYYIEMLHTKAPDAVTLVNAPKECTSKLEQPKPDMEQVVLAASLDKTQKASDGLGLFFAEAVTVKCG
jgi:ABC-type uncharacterized transport system substrate-binding protein